MDTLMNTHTAELDDFEAISLTHLTITTKYRFT